MGNNITFKRLILLFTAVIIPLFLFSFFLLYYHITASQNHMIATLQEKTDLTAQTFDHVIKQLYDTEIAVATQSTLARITYSKYPIKAYALAQEILQLQEQQTSIQKSNSYIQNFIIYYKNQGKAYNSTHYAIPIFFNFTEAEYQQMIDLYTLPGYLALYNNQLTEIVLPSINPDFILRIDLSSEAIKSLLSSTFHEYTFYYLLDGFDSSYQLTNMSPELLEQLPKTLSSSKITLEGKKHYCFSAALSTEDCQIYYLIDEAQLFTDSRIYQSMYLLLGVFTLLACIFFSWSSYVNIQKPIHILVDAFHDISHQDYSIRIPTKGISDFTYLYNEFNHMTQELETLIAKEYQQRLLLNKAELKQLQAQINPHFLYNAFFLLRRMLYDELYEEALQMSDTLGQYFQYITRNIQDYVPLWQEYNHAMLYCEIQQLRFEGRISIERDILPEEYNNILVPKLIIQPILENAFHYGLKDKVVDGLLKITLTAASDILLFSIEDNGEDLDDTKLIEIQHRLTLATQESISMEMTGMLNIQQRLHIYSNGRSHLAASRSPLGGLRIQLFLSTQQPFIKEENHVKITTS